MDPPTKLPSDPTDFTQVKTSTEDFNALINPVKDNNNIESKNGRSKTLSSEAAPLGHSKLSTKLSSFSSKTKPIAPKVKSSVTIGVASGAEALKAINTMSSNSSISNNDITSSDRQLKDRDGNYSANRKLLHEIRQKQLEEQQLHLEAPLISRENRPSITRIITSDTSFQSAQSSDKNVPNR